MTVLVWMTVLMWALLGKGGGIRVTNVGISMTGLSHVNLTFFCPFQL